MSHKTNINKLLQAVIKDLQEQDHFLLVTHEHPDGDALGSLLGMNALLSRLGKDVVMYMAAAEFPLPQEYRLFKVDNVQQQLPSDVAQRTIIFLDCGNVERNPVAAQEKSATHTINIDHHHDNTNFANTNCVLPEASCTAEIIWELANQLDVQLDATTATVLYVGLVTDTGRFMYSNTTVRAHEMAAALIAAGVNVHAVYHQLYEEVLEHKLRLLGIGLTQLQRFDDGQLTLTYISGDQFSAVGANEKDSEGIIDHLRAVDGTAMAVFIRDRLGEGEKGLRKVSLRAARPGIDVSIIARGQNGGGHPQAAGFTTELSLEQLIPFLRSELAKQI